MKRNLLYLVMCLLAVTFANAQVTSVAIVGEAVGGWPGDPGNPGPADVHQMTSTDGENWSVNGLVVTNAATGGGAKFRANNAWVINWGAATFPSGTGAQNGDNILTIGGTYDVTFNSTTGVYNFGGGAPIPVVKLVGTAATGGSINMATSDATNYTLTNVTLLAGTAQFNIDGNDFGSNTFPTGMISDPNLFIPVPAGTYSSVTVNTSTGDYNFVAAPVFPSIAIVGPGAGGWPNDPQIDANVLATADGETYKGTVTLTAGPSPDNEIKFRTNNDWNQPNYGGVSFPAGPDPTNPAGNIVVTVAGTYDVVFTRSTGAYVFSFPGIAIVGAGTAFGWPNDPQIDPLQLLTTDGANYTLSDVVLTATDPNNVVKFRTNNDWSQPNFGGVTFPSGPDPLDLNGNIVVTTASTYTINFNRITRAYTFTDQLATTAFNSADFRVYPNPTQNSWNFTSLNSTIESIQIVNVLGKTIMTIAPNSTAANVDASALNAGIYFAKIATATATQTVKLIKN